MDKELASIVQSVDSIVKLAYNTKPKEHKNIGMTRAEVDKVITETVSMIQSKLIALSALQAAVKLSPDNENISKKALELFDHILTDMGFNNGGG